MVRNSQKIDLRKQVNFFIHCESNGISSTVRLYIIKGDEGMYITDFEKDVFEAIGKLSVPIPNVLFRKQDYDTSLTMQYYSQSHRGISLFKG